MRPALLIAIALLLASASAEANDDCRVGLESKQAVTAFVALERCLAAEPGSELRAKAKKALKATREKLRSGRYGEVALAIEPSDASVTISGVGLTVRGDQDLFLPFGKHTLTLERDGYDTVEIIIDVEGRGRRAVIFSLSKSRTEKPSATAGSVDFSADPPPALPASRPQEASEFDSLMPSDYAKGQPRDSAASDDAARSPRWPWAIVVTGVAIGVGGVVAHTQDRQRLAVGLYLGGAAVLGGGGTALMLTRRKRTIPPDPELKLSVAYAWTF